MIRTIKMNAEEAKVGCFQTVLVIIFAVNYAIVAMSHAIPTFHNFTPKFYCETPDGTNRTYGCVSSPVWTNASVISRGQVDDDKASAVGCKTGYIFITETTERTVVMDWSLICDNSHLINLGPTIYCIGMSMGAWIAGFLADRFGRLPVLSICLYAQGTMAVAAYIVQSYPAFLGLRGVQGVFAQGLQASTYILALEIFPTRFRTLVATIVQIGWALGIVLLAILSRFIPDWRILQLAVSVPTAVTVLYIWLIPESPRWLIAKDKMTEADIALEKIVKYNLVCSSGSRPRVLVADETDNSVISTPAPAATRPAQRKSRVTSQTAKCDIGESTNLLTPPNPAKRKSRGTSIRVITENLEKRLSNGEGFDPVITVRDENSEIEKFPEASMMMSSSSSSSERKRESGTSTNSEKTVEPRMPESDELLTIMTTTTTSSSPAEVIAGDIEEALEIDGKTAHCNTRRNRYLTKHLIVMSCEWFTATVTQSIVLEISPELNDDRHASFAIGGCFEMAIYSLTYFILTIHGRRLPMTLCQFSSGVVGIIVGVLAIFPYHMSWWVDPATTVFLLIGRATTTSLIAIAYLFTVEIFPTVIRGACLGICAIFGMLGTLSAPHILSLKNHTTSAAPLVIVGCLCLISALICMTLPETLNTILPDTVQKMERKSTRNKVGVERCEDDKPEPNDKPSERQILREKLFSEDWVDAGNGIIVNFSENKS